MTNSCSTMVISFLTSNLHLLTALNAYLSTPKFVTILTDLSLELIYQTDRDDFLMTELKKINKRLPAAVYIPFVNDSVRNYAILHIVADEAKIFQTKERFQSYLVCYNEERQFCFILKPSDQKS